MQIPLSNVDAMLRLPATESRLSSLRVGQRLQVLVERNQPEGLLLNVLGRRITAQTRLPVSAGERLTVQVQALQPQIALKVLEGSNRATETRALMAQLLPRQQPVGEAMGQIVRTSVDPRARQLPQPLQQVLTRLSEALPTRAEAANPTRLRGLLEHSGLFLERVLGQMVSRDASSLAGQDLKALLQQAAVLLRQGLGRGGQAAASGATRGPQPTPAPQVAANVVPVLEGLLGQVESALSRIQLLQLQPAISQSALDLTVEIPLRDGADMDNLYLRIRKDGGGESGRAGENEPVYQLVVRLDFERLGAAQATLRMQGETVSAVWHSADHRLSAAIERHLPELEARIRSLGLEPESIISVHAAPPREADDIRQPPSGILHEQA